MATIDEPGSIAGAVARVIASSARAFALSVQSQCLSSVSSAGRITPVAALWTTTRYGPAAASSATTRRLRDLAAHEHRLGAGRAHRLGRRLRRRVVAHVAEHGAGGAVADEPQRDGQADTPRSPGHEDRGSSRAHCREGSGASAGAELGSSLQPGRVRGSRAPSSAFDDAWPSRSSSAIFSFAYSLHGMVVRQVEDELLDARPQLVREVRRRRPDEGVDVGVGGLGHRRNPNGRVGHVRRLSPVDAMLLGTVLLWALNITVTRYMFLHGWSPLAYGTIRYFAATRCSGSSRTPVSARSGSSGATSGSSCWRRR